MSRPKMVVVAGPPGAGKSTVFPVSEEGFDFFNADDRCARLHGSYEGIPPEVRAQVNAELRSFIADHIQERKSFAFETTFQNPIFFEQAQAAQAVGFEVQLTYIALESVALHIERVAARAERGGHSAPPAVIEDIYLKSVANLPRALHEVNSVEVLDNTRLERGAELLLRTRNGEVEHLHPQPPEWLKRALRGTEYDADRLRERLEKSGG